jgi:hypothetical protein
MDRGGESRSGNILRLFSILGSRDEILDGWFDHRPDYGKQQAARQSVGWMMPPS